MHLFGIGIDVVEVERVASSIGEFGEQFLKRIFTEKERAYCESQKRPQIHYAARFSAKEAVSKAFGTGLGKDLAWTDIEVLRQGSGEPQAVISGKGKKFMERNKIVLIKVSLTHAEHYAAANAVAMCEPTS